MNLRNTWFFQAMDPTEKREDSLFDMRCKPTNERDFFKAIKFLFS